MVNRHVKFLVTVLDDDEEVEKIASARIDDMSGVLAATGHRLVFVRKGLFSSETYFEDFPYEKIQSIHYKMARPTHTLSVVTLGRTVDLTGIPTDEEVLIDLVKFIQKKIEDFSTSTSSNPSQADWVSQLEKLAKLKEQGILSEEEFQEQKDKLLDRS
ncbi:MAG TPA: PH domain-containing protein [Bacillales bacterium]|nr:PH domain-containing protein [Bacillales bacterium]